MNVTIVGFGNLAHALVGFLGNKKNVSINVFSLNPIKTHSVVVENIGIEGKVRLITSEPKEVIPNSELILFTVPAFARELYLRKISRYISEGTIIGSFPGVGGFDEEINKILIQKNNDIFASQRVPYIARIKKRGKSVIATPKKEIYIAVKSKSNRSEYIKNLLETLLNMKVNLLNNFLEVSLSNSNPILHSARLYSLFKEKLFYDRPILFYEEWNDESSLILLELDNEFMKIVHKFNLNIKSLKEHYEVKNYKEMTLKIRSIEAFKGIYTPMKKVGDVFIPDITSRYFTEDIDFGLKYIIDFAKKNKITIPKIEKIYRKLIKIMNEVKKYADII